MATARVVAFLFAFSVSGCSGVLNLNAFTFDAAGGTPVAHDAMLGGLDGDGYAEAVTASPTYLATLAQLNNHPH
jgi:hypothetical protein